MPLLQAAAVVVAEVVADFGPARLQSAPREGLLRLRLGLAAQEGRPRLQLVALVEIARLSAQTAISSSKDFMAGVAQRGHLLLRLVEEAVVGHSQAEILLLAALVEQESRAALLAAAVAPALEAIRQTERGAVAPVLRQSELVPLEAGFTAVMVAEDQGEDSMLALPQTEGLGVSLWSTAPIRLVPQARHQEGLVVAQPHKAVSHLHSQVLSLLLVAAAGPQVSLLMAERVVRAATTVLVAAVAVQATAPTRL